MSREWSDLLVTGRRPLSASPLISDGGEEADDDDAKDVTGGRRGGLRALRRLRESLRATRQALGSDVAAKFSKTLVEHDWEALEEALISADVGVATTTAVVERLASEVRRETLDEDALKARLAALLAQTARGTSADGEPLSDTIDLRATPTVILLVGVNGTGKTTTIGKLAWQLQEGFGLRVLMAAGDTFRAAATEQLEGWAARAGAEIVTGPSGSDPGAVAFEAVARARAEHFDVVLIDTAGRLHTQDNLMAELAKIRRVIAKQLDGAPHETLMTLDATTGQNGLRQAELFSRAVEVDGIVLTKLDGSARGGVAVAIANDVRIPVKLIGVGEQLDDLRPFDPQEFAEALIA